MFFIHWNCFPFFNIFFWYFSRSVKPSSSDSPTWNIPSFPFFPASSALLSEDNTVYIYVYPLKKNFWNKLEYQYKKYLHPGWYKQEENWTENQGNQFKTEGQRKDFIFNFFFFILIYFYLSLKKMYFIKWLKNLYML